MKGLDIRNKQKDDEIAALIKEFDEEFGQIDLSRAYAEMDKVTPQKKRVTDRPRRRRHSRARRIVAAVSACLLLGLLLIPVAGRLIALTYNYANMALARRRVDSAQYTPNIDILAAQTQSSPTTLAAQDDGQSDGDPMLYSLDTDMTRADYEKIVGTAGLIETGGAYDPGIAFRSVYEIKDEIYRVLGVLPRFNYWYHEKNDFDFCYYAEINDAKDRLTVTRVSGFFFTSYWDFEQQQVVADKGLFRGTWQMQVIKADYYYDDENREVVEIEALNFFSFKGDCMPIMYQKVKNVKDTSFSKVTVRAAADLNYYSGSFHPASGSTVTLDTRGTTPYGAWRSFMQFDYTNGDDVRLMTAEQMMPYDVLRAPVPATQLKLYTKIGDEIVCYTAYHDSHNETPMSAEGDFAPQGNLRSMILDDLGDLDDYYQRNNIPSAFAFTGRYFYGFRQGNYSEQITSRFVGLASVNSDTGFLLVPQWFYEGRGTANSRATFAYVAELNSGMFDGLGGESLFDNFPLVFKKSAVIPNSDAYVIAAHTPNYDFAELAALQNSTEYPLSAAGIRAFSSAAAAPRALAYSLAALSETIGVGNDKVDALLDATPAALDFADKTYAFETEIDRLLNAVSTRVVDGSTLVGKMKVYKNAPFVAFRNALVNGRFGASAVAEVNTLDGFAAVAAINGGTAQIRTEARVEPNITLNPKAEYALGFVMRNESGDFYVLGTAGAQRYRKNKPLEFDISEEFELDGIPAGLPAGHYRLGMALTTQSGNRAVVCSDFVPLTFGSANGLPADRLVESGGFVSRISFGRDNAGGIYVDIGTDDIESPSITGDLSKTLNQGDAMLRILDEIELNDNDLIASVRVFDENGMPVGMSRTADSGVYTVVVTDRSGNSTSVSVFVSLK